MAESTSRPMPTGDELMRTAPILVWMAGADKLCLYCNEAWLDFTGRRFEECLGEGWIRDVHPDDREKVLREYVQAFDARAQFKIEYRLLHKSKKYRWIHSYGIPRFTDGAQFVGYIVSAIDVSDRKALDTLRLRMTASFSLAQEQERQRIGQELHDDIGQRLISTSINLNTIAWSVTDSELKSKLLEITEEMQVVISDLGRMSRNMRGLPVMIVGLVPALKALCDRISRKTGIQIDFRIRNLTRAIPADASTVLFRVAQEALVNLVKHSGATHARVTLLVSRNEAIQLSISDSGIGFSTEQSGKTPGFGLISMRERARLAGGRLSIRSKHEKGTCVMARIPLLQEGLAAEVAPSMLIDSWSERVSASLAHSINNPLEAAIGALYMASHNPDTPPVVQDELKTAQDQLHRLAQLLQRVLSAPKEVDTGLT